MNNPIQLLKVLMSKNKNPQEIAMQLIGNNNNSVVNNLITMAKNGDKKGIENFARNIFREQGRDFDKEYAQMQEMINKMR